MDLLLQLQAIVVLIALILIYHRWFVKGNHLNKSKAIEAPEAPGAWPVIGHLFKLANPQPLFRSLADMVDKHGPIFTVRFGIHPTLVISSRELAKECFTTNDKAFASRPRTAAGKYLAFDYQMIGFAPYGAYWRETRKCVVLELLSNRRLESLKRIRYAEVETCMKDLHGLWAKNNGNQVKVEMSRLFRDLTMNLVLKMVVGKRYFSVVGVEYDEEAKRIQKSIDDFFRLAGVSVASDALPSFLSWMDLDGEQRAMKKAAKEMDVITERWLKEHRQKRLSGKGDGDEQDFMDVMLSILEEDAQFHGHDRDAVVKATVMALMLAATDPIAVTLSWTLSLLLNNKQVLRKAQDELDFHVGKDRKVEEKDIGNLTYLQAIIKETLRLFPDTPLLIPHEAIEDCTVSEFRIPKGTRLIVNLWKIHRDPSIWSNPLEFQPERFLTSHPNLDVWGKNFEFIPFGSGRRSCPGISFSLLTLQMMLARLVHEFELQTPSNEPVDMTERMGLSMSKKTPLDVLLSPRVLPSQLYG
ncbi:cytochrome P450 CYP82D47-like [Macadamia integrifolia]|uniref:cytochrome P450 CYP82D47-like n=1 Tax=Macadamia integrifolia TaxID=60698 RepID=UPI001C4E5C15|nr:cytochrome P450 CYP82D47-like [Macadamia integrifolia]